MRHLKSTKATTYEDDFVVEYEKAGKKHFIRISGKEWRDHPDRPAMDVEHAVAMYLQSRYGQRHFKILTREMGDSLQAIYSNRKETPSAPTVPAAAERMLAWALPVAMQEAMLGDFAQRFHERVAKDGVRAARAWYWWQTARSILPLLLRLGGKLLAIRELLEKLRM